MSEPSPFDGVSFVLLGGFVVAFRRSIARQVKAKWDTFDRAYDEDALALFNAVIGGVAIVMGIVLFLLWVTA